MVFQNVSFVVELALWALTLGVKGFAFVDAARRSTAAFVAVGKQPKPFWLIVLGISLLAAIVSTPLAFWNLIGLVAALVYLFGIRPELQQYGGGSSGRGDQHMGPYGPW